MCDKTAANQLYPLKVVSDGYMAQKTSNKVFSTYPFTAQIVHDAIRFKKCIIKLLMDVFLFDFVPDRYKTQTLCYAVADDFLAALEFMTH